jgi:hypothetical protein
MTTLTAEERGDMAEDMLPVAANLAVLVHGDGGPEDVQTVLDGLDEAQRAALIVVLAGLVDPDQPMGRALGWLDHDEAGALTVPHWGDKQTIRDMAPADDELAGGDDAIDLVAVGRFVDGWPVSLSEAEYLRALQECFARGMSCSQIDAMRRLLERTTENNINRLRKAYRRSGRPFPDLQPRRVNEFTEEQVIAIRERSAGGATDMEISLTFGVARKAISNVVSGHSYRNFGGPIRTKRTTQPSTATRVLWARSQEAFLKTAV